MNMTIHTTISHDVLFSRNDICVRTNNHVGINTLHDIRITCLANTYNDSVLDTNVGLEDTSVVNNQGVCQNQVQAINVGAAGSLTHAVANTLTTSERTLVAVVREVLLDLDPEIGCAQADEITSGRAKHGDVSLALDGEHINVGRIARGLGSMVEAALLQLLNKGFGNSCVVDGPSSKAIAALDDLVASDLDQSDGLGVARFETDRGSCSNIQSVTTSSDTVKIE